MCAGGGTVGRPAHPDAPPRVRGGDATLPRRYLDVAGRAADPLDMRCILAVVVALVAGCHLRVGMDAASRSTGPLQAVMTRSTVSRTDGVLNLPPANGRNYA